MLIVLDLIKSLLIVCPNMVCFAFLGKEYQCCMFPHRYPIVSMDPIPMGPIVLSVAFLGKGDQCCVTSVLS